jgi:hypothetical protein
MEVEFGHTHEYLVEVSVRQYKGWLDVQRPLVGTEFAICCVLFFISLAAGVGLVGFLGFAVWQGMAWYYVVGAAALFVFVCGMFLEVVRPRREPVRGLFQELTFRMNLQDQLLAKVKARRAVQFRRLEEKGELVLTHRYNLRLDTEGLTLTTDYPAAAGTATRQEDRFRWDAVRSVEVDDHLLSFTLNDGRCVFVPRTAFADGDACARFVRAAEALRAAPAPADTRIKAPGAVFPGVGTGSPF